MEGKSIGIGQLRYKQYGNKWLLRLLSTENLWFSRRLSYSDSAVNRADRITVSAGKTGPNDINLTIKAVFFTNVDSVTEQLRAKGFTEKLIGDYKALVRVWEFGITACQDSLPLLQAILKAADEVAAELPLMLYSSTERNLLLDYSDFMASSSLKVDVRKLFAEFGECAELTQSGACPLLVTQKSKGEWLAWLPGDELAFSFPSQKAAVASAEKRKRLLAPWNRIFIQFYETPGRKLYQLIDNKKSLRERIRWLKNESARLERLLPSCGDMLEQAR